MRTKAECLDALRREAEYLGRTPSYTEWRYMRPHQAPAASTIRRHFGSWSKACAEAGLLPRERGGRHDLAGWKLDDTAAVIQALRGGATLKALAAERGISGQSLGRRVRRYQRALGDRVVNRPPGRPASGGAEK